MRLALAAREKGLRGAVASLKIVRLEGGDRIHPYGPPVPAPLVPRSTTDISAFGPSCLFGGRRWHLGVS
jgi:hypothetical protein